ncbi:ethylene-overproduction protein 1-like [Mangifera indica]|uniref:ethylene-overproduction protein 1-like n=1 Tax=Mangifera indica TaxID=29780 RepID=UPI001CFC2F5D|nr:ethylene-overproduction protein 1-like [Mangifera indica]
MDCSGFVLNCPVAALVSRFEPNSVYDNCKCCEGCSKLIEAKMRVENDCLSLEEKDEENKDFAFCIGDEEINFNRYKVAALSSPFKGMLYGDFTESRRDKIDFSQSGISVEGMRAVKTYIRSRRVDLFCPGIVLELLSFANRFCCEEMKSFCDAHLASLVVNIEDALILIEYGLEERANLLVASCLQVLLRELPSSLYNPKVLKIFYGPDARERLAMWGMLLSYCIISLARWLWNRT